MIKNLCSITNDRNLPKKPLKFKTQKKLEVFNGIYNIY